MSWTTISSLLVPLIKPLLLAGVAWLGKLISDSLIHFIKNQKYAYARTLATVAVSAIEDGYEGLSGSGKLQAAIARVAKQIKLPPDELADIVRAAYQATIVPLDALKNAQAPSPTPSIK